MMVGHRQTIFHTDPTPGNCLQAAVATYLNWDSLDDVPHFVRYSDARGSEFSDPDNLWWFAYHGFFALLDPPHRLISVETDTVPDRRCIVAGKSPRGDFTHSVVYEDGEMVWDPHPSDDGIDDIQTVEWAEPWEVPQ